MLDKMERPDAVTIKIITDNASGTFQDWLNERSSRRVIPHRLEKCGYVQVRKPNAQDGLWVINGARQVVYARSEISAADKLKAARDLARRIGW